jgi:NADPH:quinone reductase-like Zn-dependent oxidoreductase
MGHILVLGPQLAKSERQEIGMMGMASVSSTDLAFIGGLLESRKIVPVIDKTYPLSETAQALRHFEEEHARGKIVISVA